MPAQTRQLRQRLDRQLAEPSKPTVERSRKTAKPNKVAVPRAKTPLPIEEIQSRMLASGLITRLPDPALDIDDDDADDQPVPIKGESLSETIIRERR